MWRGHAEEGQGNGTGRNRRREDAAHRVVQMTMAMQKTTTKFHGVFAKFCSIITMFHGNYKTYWEIADRFKNIAMNTSPRSSVEIITRNFEALQKNYDDVCNTDQIFRDTDPYSAATSFAEFLKIDATTEQSQNLKIKATEICETLVNTIRKGAEVTQKFLKTHRDYKTNVSTQLHEMIAMCDVMPLAACFQETTQDANYLDTLKDFVEATELLQKTESKFNEMATSTHLYKEQPTSLEKYEERYSLLLSLIEEF